MSYEEEQVAFAELYGEIDGEQEAVTKKMHRLLDLLGVKADIPLLDRIDAAIWKLA